MINKKMQSVRMAKKAKKTNKNLLGLGPDVLPVHLDDPLARLAIDRTACVWTIHIEKLKIKEKITEN
jgi:hypothetical protein